MNNQYNNSYPQPQVPPRANNYPNPLINNQNIWNSNPAPRPSQNGGNGPVFNNRPPINNNANFNNRPPPPRTVTSPSQQPSIPQRGGTSNPPNLPQPRQNSRNQPQTLPINQLSSPQSPPPRSNIDFNNVQVSTNQNIQQRRTHSQKELPGIPVGPKKSTNSLGRNASSIKTKFVDIVNRSLSRKFSSNKQEKSKRLSSYGGMNVHSAYRNSLMAKPVYDSKLLLKPQNPNFIISLGLVFMIASVSLAIAFVALRNGGLTESKIHDISSEDSYGFIFFATFMLMIGLTGYIAYHKKWTSLLITYSVFLVFGFIVQLIIIFLFLNIYIHPLTQMRKKWIDVLSEAEKQTIQEGYQCCGYLSVVDHGLTTSMCMPDTGSTTLTIKSAKAMRSSLNYLNDSVINNLNKRQDSDGNAVQDLKTFYKTKDPNSYTEDDIKDEGCARVIVSAIKSGLLQYILIEVAMAILFVVAFYFAVMHFKEQLAIEKEVDSARATFG